MATDFRGIWIGRIARRRDRLASLLSGIVNRVSAFVRGVKIGKNCLFVGKVYFRRVEFSSIIIGDNCTFRSSRKSNLIGINRPCMISTLKRDAVVKIGSACGLSGTVIGAAQSVEIGNNVLIGANTTITDTDWHGMAPDKRRKEGVTSPVIIEDNVFIGINAIVLKGVTIGKNSVIGAGSVVTKSIPGNVIAGGQPARVLKTLESQGMQHV